MDAKSLRNLLGDIRQLECDRYTIKQTIEKLQSSKKSTPHKEFIMEPILITQEATKYSDIVKRKVANYEHLRLLILSAIPSVLIWISSKSFFVGLFFFILILAIRFLITLVTSALEFGVDGVTKKTKDTQYKKEYEKELIAYKKQSTAAEHKYKNQLANVKKHNSIVDFQISKLEETDLMINEALNALYRKCGIRDNYRGLIPVCRFCYYIDSGLRTYLEGNGGMYEYYEDELYKRTITDKLDTIRASLDDINYQLGNIQKNQALTVEAISQSQRVSQNILNSTNQLLKQSQKQSKELSEIQMSSALAAYHAEATSRSVQAMERVQKEAFDYEHPNSWK